MPASRPMVVGSGLLLVVRIRRSQSGKFAWTAPIFTAYFPTGQLRRRITGEFGQPMAAIIFLLSEPVLWTRFGRCASPEESFSGALQSRFDWRPDRCRGANWLPVLTVRGFLPTDTMTAPHWCATT